MSCSKDNVLGRLWEWKPGVLWWQPCQISVWDTIHSHSQMLLIAYAKISSQELRSTDLATMFCKILDVISAPPLFKFDNFLSYEIIIQRTTKQRMNFSQKLTSLHGYRIPALQQDQYGITYFAEFEECLCLQKIKSAT